MAEAACDGNDSLPLVASESAKARCREERLSTNLGDMKDSNDLPNSAEFGKTMLLQDK